MHTLSYEPTSQKDLFEAGEEQHDFGSVQRIVGPSVFEVPHEVNIDAQPQTISFVFVYPNDETPDPFLTVSAIDSNLSFRLASHTRKIIELRGGNGSKLLASIAQDPAWLMRHLESSSLSVPKSASRSALVVGRLLAGVPQEIKERILAAQS